jgi:hypothetical protein
VKLWATHFLGSKLCKLHTILSKPRQIDTKETKRRVYSFRTKYYIKTYVNENFFGGMGRTGIVFILVWQTAA